MNPNVEKVRLVGGLYDGIELFAQVGCAQIFMNSDPSPQPERFRFELYQRDLDTQNFLITPITTGVVIGMPEFYKPPHNIPFHWSHDATGQMHALVERFMASQVGGPDLNDEDFKTLLRWCVHYINAPCWDRVAADDEQELSGLRSQLLTIKTPDELYSWSCDCRDIGLDPL